MTDITITEADWHCAADLAAMSERICFGGNDAAALRNMVAGDKTIAEFVRVVAEHRLSAIEEAAKVVEQQSEVNARARIDRADDELAFEFRGLGNVIATAIRALAQPPVAKDIRKMREG